MDKVVVSPVEKDPAEVPRISLAEYIFPIIRSNANQFGDKLWAVDVTTGTSVKFCDIEDHSRRVASALSRRGFSKGDVLYFVTYEMAQLYVIQLAVWRLGGAVRGCFQAEPPAEYARQLRETRSRVVLVDVDTAPLLREASAELEWPVELISVGPTEVAGTTSFQQLCLDDGQACPTNVQVDLFKDAVFIPSTSGSTGVPKGAVHTHFSLVCLLYGMRSFGGEHTSMTLANNYAVANFSMMIMSLMNGSTIYFVAKFCREEFFGLLRKYKPQFLMIYPYVATWFCRSPEILTEDLSFIFGIMLGGSVLDIPTLELIETRLPQALCFQVYGITESIAVSNTMIGYNFVGKSIKIVENQGEQCVSSGKLGPYIQAKVRDRDTGAVLGHGQRGEIMIRAPHLMAGYLRGADKPFDSSDIDQDGWFNTGDLGFFDDEGNIYIKERFSFIFKYYMHFVSPSDIETVLITHPAVQSVGVVGIPHPETTSLARAFVVLRDGCSATCQQLQRHVEERLPAYMHLHGGVRFLPVLPMNRGGKLDRGALKHLALQEESAN